MSSIKFVYFGLIGKTRWPPWPLIGWDIFSFSETAEWYLMKLHRKQGLKILYQVCVFRVDRKNKTATLASDWLRCFQLLLLNCWTEFNKLDRKQDLNVLYQVCVFGADRKNKMAALASDWLRHFRFSSETAEPNSTKLDRKQDLNILYQVLSFSGRLEKQDGCPSLCLAETFLTSPLKLLNGIQWN